MFKSNQNEPPRIEIVGWGYSQSTNIQYIGIFKCCKVFKLPHLSLVYHVTSFTFVLRLNRSVIKSLVSRYPIISDTILKNVGFSKIHEH